LSYPAVVQEVKMLMARKPIAGECELIIDETGVGRAVGDIFNTAGMSPTRLTITAASNRVTSTALGTSPSRFDFNDRRALALR